MSTIYRRGDDYMPEYQGLAGPIKTVFRIEGMDCADCAAKLEQRIAGIPV